MYLDLNYEIYFFILTLRILKAINGVQMSVVGSIQFIFILRKNPKNEGGGGSQLCHPKLSHPWPRRSRCNAHNATFQPPFLSLKPEFLTEFKGNANFFFSHTEVLCCVHHLFSFSSISNVSSFYHNIKCFLLSVSWLDAFLLVGLREVCLTYETIS